MIPKSIKWRLQLWYGLILVAVLIGFGVTAYQLERNRIFRRVDDEIHRRIGAIAQQLHGPPHGGHPGHPQGEFPPPPEFGDEGQPGPNARPKFELTPQLVVMFETNDPESFYFIIEARDGHTVATSAFQPGQIAEDQQAELPPGNGSSKAGQGPPRQIGIWREFSQTLPSGERIRVGCSTAPEEKDLRIQAAFLASAGGIVLLLGVTGGWIFVGRALRPITAISSAATKISAGDLSQRINAAEAESELGQLAAVLNSTFARLETAFAQQRQFASDAAHELRTPITVILTQTQMALHKDRDAASYKQTLEACERAAQRMRKLIESLLELARFDAGQEVLKRLKFNLSEVVSDCAELVQSLAEERRVKIVSSLTPVEITGDSERVSQVVTNLVTNAIQYNKPDGEVRLTLEAQGGLAVLEIADTGKGIEQEHLPHVFERFYRADKSRTGASNSGLGLSICKAIVEAHGGTIEVSSAKNVGTNFTVRLPIN